MSDECKEYYTSITKKTGKQVYIPGILLEAANIQDGDYIEVKIRKLKTKNVKEHDEEEHI